MTDKIQVYGSVILAGSAEGLTKTHSEITPKFRCYHYRDNALLVSDVAEHELIDIEKTAQANGVWVEQVRDSHMVRLAEEAEDPNAVKQPKQPNLELIEGGWYKTNNKSLPLIHVIKVRNEIQPDGIQLWLFEVDFVAADALPQPATLSAEQLKSYSPKPASIDDFENLDIIPPDGFTPTPHAIPSVDDEQDEYEDKQEEISGVPLPQAQAAVMLLQKQPGLRSAKTKIVQVASGKGFYVRCRPRRRVALMPTEIAGTLVRYC